MTAHRCFILIASAALVFGCAKNVVTQGPRPVTSQQLARQEVEPSAQGTVLRGTMRLPAEYVANASARATQTNRIASAMAGGSSAAPAAVSEAIVYVERATLAPVAPTLFEASPNASRTGAGGGAGARAMGPPMQGTAWASFIGALRDQLPPGLSVKRARKSEAKAAPAPPRRPVPTMSQREESFEPRVVVVAVGDTVAFVNHDHVFHNAFSVSSIRTFDVGKLGPGSSRRVAFSKAGVVPVFCDLHPAAAGYVFVAPTASYVQPSADGMWAFSNLPAGDYVVRAWHPDYGERRWKVTLPPEGRELSLGF